MRAPVLLIVALLVAVAAAGNAEMPTKKEFVNSIGMRFVRIEAGTFMMGHEGALADEVVNIKEFSGRVKVWVPKTGDFDERPVHKVTISKPFYMATHEVANQQYELFDPLHVHLRGKRAFSIDNSEAVVFVSWDEANAFCQWLTRKEGLGEPGYRLPTEAEWEYACRAGTTTAFSTGDTLPGEFVRNPDNSWYPCPQRGRGRAEVVPLYVGRTSSNPWGLYDMHGNVEEWCHDWYGPYEATDQVDPIGRIDGDFKVTRGGSHSTYAFYMRSTNRLGTLPEDKSRFIGFRVVLGPMPNTMPLPPTPLARYQQNVNQQVPADVTKGPNPGKPYFRGPRSYVRIPDGAEGPLFDRHNHVPAIVECPNGDLLAIWYTTVTETGREVALAASRLRYGVDQWELASPFFDAPDRNDSALALWYDGDRTIYHFNGVSSAATWAPLAVVMRTSKDNGVTWSKTRLIVPEHQRRNQVAESVFRTREGYLVLPCDANPGGDGGTALHISRDGGLTWADAGGTIAGIHAAVAQLSDGRLMAFGRGDTIKNKMPKSVSSDMGRTWQYSPSDFQPISWGQRAVLLRLKEGPLFFAAFCHEMMIKDASGNLRPVTGPFAAISLDEGNTWSYRRLITDDGPGREIATMDGHLITMNGRNAEPVGYLTVCQSANGLIHLLSSRQHYAFNLAWIKTLPPTPPPPPSPSKARNLPVKHTLPNVYRPKGLPSQDKWRWDFSARSLKESDVISVSPEGLLKINTDASQQFWLRTEETDIFGAADQKRGFTAEIRTQVLKRSANQRGIDLEIYDGAGSRYVITITDTGIYWYEGLIRGSALLPFSQYTPLAEGLDNTDAMHTYRLAVREDRVAQIYRDGKLLGVQRYEYRTPRYPYIFIGAGPGLQALVEYVAYDLNGPSQP